MAAPRNPAVRAQHAFNAGVDARSVIAAWPTFAKALHAAASKIDEATALRYRRLAASAVTVTEWNERATVGSGTPDPGVLALAQEISDSQPIRGRAKAAARLDAITWAATGTLLSRVHDHLGDLRVSGQDDIATAIRDLRRTRATIAAANLEAEVDYRSAEGSAGVEPLSTWEAEAGRAVAQTPTTLTLWMVARQQEVNSANTIATVAHHHHKGGIDGIDAERLLEALEANRQSWAGVRDSLAPLAIGARPLTPDLIGAGEVAAAHLHDLQHGSTRQMRQHLAVFLAGSVNLAATTTAAIESGRLQGPAAAINRRSMELQPRQEGAHVNPVALHQRRIIPVTAAVRSDLTFQSMQLRDSLEWTANVAQAAPDPWQATRSARREAPRREPSSTSRGRSPSRDL